MIVMLTLQRCERPCMNLAKAKVRLARKTRQQGPGEVPYRLALREKIVELFSRSLLFLQPSDGSTTARCAVGDPYNDFCTLAERGR